MLKLANRQKHIFIHSTFNDMADILGQSEILKPDAKKRQNSTRQKHIKNSLSA